MQLQFKERAVVEIMGMIQQAEDGSGRQDPGADFTWEDQEE